MERKFWEVCIGFVSFLSENWAVQTHFQEAFDQKWKENSGKFELVFCPKTVLCRLNIGFLARQTPHMIMSSAELRLSIFGTSIILNFQTPPMYMSSAG